MDPNATLELIDSFLKERRTGDIVDEYCEDLHGWLSKGGFEPDWSAFELGASYYRVRCVYMDRPEYKSVAG